MDELDMFLEKLITASLPWIKYHEESELPRLIMVGNDKYWELPLRDYNREEIKYHRDNGAIIKELSTLHEEEIHDDPIEVVHEEPFIEDIVEDPPYVTTRETIENWGPSRHYFSDEDHICNLGQFQHKTIIESYNETYDEISNVHDGNPTFSPYDMMILV